MNTPSSFALEEVTVEVLEICKRINIVTKNIELI